MGLGSVFKGIFGGGAGGASAGPLGAIAGGVLGGVAGAFGGGGGSSSSSGYTLPPEYELQFLQQMQQNLDYTQQQYQQSNDLYNTFNDRLNLIQGAMSNTIPSNEALAQMRQSNISLAQQLGASAEDLVKNGFITKDDQAHLQDYQNAVQGKLEDPGLKQQHLEQRRQLQQDLARQGVPPAQQQIALQQFDQNSRSEMFNRSVGLAQGIAGGLNLSSALRQQGYNQALGSNQNLMGQLGFAQQGLGQMANFGQMGYQAGMGNLQYQLGLQNQANQQYTTLGQFKLSGTTKDAIKSGLVGPGTYAQQTGIARGKVGQFANMQSTYDNARTQNMLDQYKQNFVSYNNGNQGMWGDYIGKGPGPSISEYFNQTQGQAKNPLGQRYGSRFTFNRSV